VRLRGDPQLEGRVDVVELEHGGLDLVRVRVRARLRVRARVRVRVRARARIRARARGRVRVRGRGSLLHDAQAAADPRTRVTLECLCV